MRLANFLKFYQVLKLIDLNVLLLQFLNQLRLFLFLLLHLVQGLLKVFLHRFNSFLQFLHLLWEKFDLFFVLLKVILELKIFFLLQHLIGKLFRMFRRNRGQPQKMRGVATVELFGLIVVALLLQRRAHLRFFLIFVDPQHKTTLYSLFHQTSLLLLFHGFLSDSLLKLQILNIFTLFILLFLQK